MSGQVAQNLVLVPVLNWLPHHTLMHAMAICHRVARLEP